MNLPDVLNLLHTWNLSVLIPLVFYTSFFLTVATLVFFVESTLILRALVLSRSRRALYLLLGLPLGASILCYIVAMYGWQVYYDWQNSFTGEHITLFTWNEILVLRYNFLAVAIIDLLQSALAIGLFALTLFLEKKLLPRVKQRPLWTVVRRQRIV
jgi:hypothetical protein